MKTVLVDFSHEFLNLSWVWLNDEEIKRLTNTPSFTLENQLNWYSSIGEISDYLIWGIEVDSKKVGACGLKNITKVDFEYWGYIGEKDYWGRGIGTIILLMITEKAKELKLKSIWLQVCRSNIRAINLYRKMNFFSEVNKDDIIIMRKRI